MRLEDLGARLQLAEGWIRSLMSHWMGNDLRVYNLTVEGTQTGGGTACHDPVTLAADADTLLGLSTQQITLDSQTRNYFLAGPTSGAAADPSFRVIQDYDVEPDNPYIVTPLYFLAAIGADTREIPELFAFTSDGDCWSRQAGIWVQRATSLGAVTVAGMERASRTLWYSTGNGTISKTVLATASDWGAPTAYDLRTLGSLPSTYNVAAVACGKVTTNDLSVLLTSTNNAAWGVIARTYDGGANWNFYTFTTGDYFGIYMFQGFTLDYYINDNGIFVGGAAGVDPATGCGRVVRLAWATGGAAPSAETCLWSTSTGGTDVRQVLTDTATSATVWMCNNGLYKCTDATSGGTFNGVTDFSAIAYPYLGWWPGGSGSIGHLCSRTNGAMWIYNGAATAASYRKMRGSADTWMQPSGNPNVEPVYDPQSGLFAACFASRPAIGGLAWAYCGGYNFDSDALPASKSVTALAWGHYEDDVTSVAGGDHAVLGHLSYALSGHTGFQPTLPAGTVTGDFIRYNTVSSAWEVAAEPVAFKGLVLTPALAALADAEGAVYYNSVNKAVMVCTDI